MNAVVHKTNAAYSNNWVFLHYTVFDMAMLLNIMMCIIIVLFSSSVQFNKEFMLYKCF